MDLSAAAATPIVPDNTSAASPSGTAAGATPTLQAPTSSMMTASTSDSSATSAYHQTGTKRKRAKKLQGLTDEEAEEKRLRTNMLEKERMKKLRAEMKRLQGHMPDEFVDDDKTSSFYNTLKFATRYIWLLNICNTTGTSKDGAAFKQGVQDILKAYKSRWQTDLIDISVISEIFENKNGSFFSNLKDKDDLKNCHDLMIKFGEKSKQLLNAFHMEAASSRHQQLSPSTPHPSNSHYTAPFAITGPTPTPQIHFQQSMNPSSAMAVRGPMSLNAFGSRIDDVSGLPKFQPYASHPPYQMWANQSMTRPPMIQTTMWPPTPHYAQASASANQQLTRIPGYMGHVSQHKVLNTNRSGMQTFTTSKLTTSQQQNYQIQMLPQQFQHAFSQANHLHASSCMATAQHPGIASCSYPLSHNPVDVMHFSPSTGLNALGIPSSHRNVATSVNFQNFGIAGYHKQNHNQLVNVQRLAPFNLQEASCLASDLDTPNGTPTMSPGEPHFKPE